MELVDISLSGENYSKKKNKDTRERIFKYDERNNYDDDNQYLMYISFKIVAYLDLFYQV